MEDLSKSDDNLRFISELARENGIFLSKSNAEYIYDIISSLKNDQNWINSLSDKEILDFIIHYII